MLTDAKKEGGGSRSKALPRSGKPDVFRHRGDYVVRFRRARLLTDPYLSISSASTAAIGLLSLASAYSGWSPLQIASPFILMASGVSLGVAVYFYWKQGRRGHEINQIRISGDILITPKRQVFSRQQLHSLYATTVMDEDDPDQLQTVKSEKSRRYAVRAKYGSLRRPVTLVDNALAKPEADGLIAILNEWTIDDKAIADASSGLHGKQTLMDI
jgi:hypothetical protein